MTMGPVSRFVRRSLNPLSTGVARRWYGEFRRVPDPQARVSLDAAPPPESPFEPGTARAGHCELSPGEWEVPAGERPGWSWMPPQGAFARPRSMPTWVRVWYMLPWVDRYAYSWMWRNGGWAIPIDD
jgi:hypothetical protein